jgi:3-isopropylmalate dehydrogenase
MKKMILMAGDGVGPEVMAQAVKALEWLRSKCNLSVEIREAEYGESYFRKEGKLLSDESLAQCEGADAILFGAVGGDYVSEVPIDEWNRARLTTLRKKFNLFANIRPVVARPELYEASSLKKEIIDGVDLIIVRELVGGVYFGQPRGIEMLPQGGRRAVDTQVYTSEEIRRVGRVAFELARGRRKQLCSVDKSNVMETGKLWRREITDLGKAEYPDVQVTHQHADNCAMQLVRRPRQFDVIVTDNLFGDLLADCAAMITGSLGMLPSAALAGLGPNIGGPALYEPVHGSAPDIAGKNLANPLAMILSLAMALRYSLDSPQQATLIENAVRDTLARGLRTKDLAQDGSDFITTEQMGNEVLMSLSKMRE